jgi:Putative peptidoglycan binding domain
MNVDPNDPVSVTWLQQGITRLYIRPLVFQIGSYDDLTRKNIRLYQRLKSLPVTGEADQATTDSIEQELAKLP